MVDVADETTPRPTQYMVKVVSDVAVLVSVFGRWPLDSVHVQMPLQQWDALCAEVNRQRKRAS
jgi:hypothetical protein